MMPREVATKLGKPAMDDAHRKAKQAFHAGEVFVTQSTPPPQQQQISAAPRKNADRDVVE